MQERLNALAQMGLDFDIPVMESGADAWMKVKGKRVLNFCSNNYLGLVSHPDLKKAAIEAVKKWGVGAGAVRYLAGTQQLHVDLENRLAKFKGTEAALYMQTGVVANMAALVSLVGKGDVVFSDQLNHASIIDGVRLSNAKTVVYDHCNMKDLEAKIKEHLPNFRRGLVVTDGVFSMDGDIAPLDKICEIAERYDLMTMVDDSHGEGVLGNGRGIVHHFNLQGKIDLEMGTLSKAFGVIGGVVAGKKVVVDFVNAHGRAYLFSTATTPADTAACLAAIDIVEKSTEIVEKLWNNTQYLKDGLLELGFDIGITQTPIIPLLLGDSDLAKKFSAHLFEENVFSAAQTYPIVPKGAARVRVMNSASHSREDLNLALAAFEKVGRELGVI